MDKAVIVKIMGGLGNQLFQYAAGKSLALRNDRRLILDLSWFRVRGLRDTKREFLLGAYNIDDECTDFFSKPGLLLTNSRFFRKLHLHQTEIVKDASSDVLTHKCQAGKDIYMDGYWQSISFFEDFNEEVVKLFELREMLSKYYSDLLKAILECPSVGLHVRRGDYVSSKTAAKYHGTCNSDYYSSAVNLCSSLTGVEQCVVFSDDIQWARRNLDLSLFKKVIFVEPTGSSSPPQEIFLLSNCHHQIIANSTFSWWGAWLNRSQSKVVIAPNHWNNSNNVAKGLIPAGWIRI